MVKNKSLIFEKVPQGYPVPGQDILIKEVDTDIENAPEGGIVTKNLYASSSPHPLTPRIASSSIPSPSSP